jgi:uncharacterized protein YodC (DUF2158 family)
MKALLIVLSALCIAASPATNPSSQPSTQPAGTSKSQRIRPDAPDAVKRLANYSFQYHQQIVKKKQDDWKSATAEMQLRVEGRVDPSKRTGRDSKIVQKKGVVYFWSFRTGAEKKMALEEQQATVAQTKAAWEAAKADTTIVLPGADVEARVVEVGWIGRVPQFLVEDVIDEHTVRAKLPAFGATEEVFGSGGPRFIITGADASDGKIKNQSRWYDVPVWITGTEKDKANNGRTIFRAEVFDVSNYLAK